MLVNIIVKKNGKFKTNLLANYGPPVYLNTTLEIRNSISKLMFVTINKNLVIFHSNFSN